MPSTRPESRRRCRMVSHSCGIRVSHSDDRIHTGGPRITAPLPALPSTASTWDQALYAFLVQKGDRSGPKRTVESCSRMLWRFFEHTTPDRMSLAIVLSYAHGIGLSGRSPSPATIAARIACPSSYFRFLIRMGLLRSYPCDLVERPRTSPSPARGYSAEQVKRPLAAIPDTVWGRPDRAILLVFILPGRRRSDATYLTRTPRLLTIPLAPPWPRGPEPAGRPRACSHAPRGGARPPPPAPAPARRRRRHQPT